AHTCIATVFILLKLLRPRLGFFHLFKKFANEIKDLNPVIYSNAESSKGILKNFYWLLKYRLYKVFSFLYVSKNYN
ncbi:MAG: hypothetical protein M3139_17085, partial [Bacteroidota bacterium]|nr:hypothetical protein [Bacteroidota bacterium]